MDFHENLNLICRTCLKFDQNVQSLFRSELHVVLRELTSLTIQPNDNYPQNICQQCYHTLKLIACFRNNCIDVQQNFFRRHALKTQQTPPKNVKTGAKKKRKDQSKTPDHKYATRANKIYTQARNNTQITVEREIKQEQSSRHSETNSDRNQRTNGYYEFESHGDNSSTPIVMKSERADDMLPRNYEFNAINTADYFKSLGLGPIDVVKNYDTRPNKIVTRSSWKDVGGVKPAFVHAIGDLTTKRLERLRKQLIIEGVKPNFKNRCSACGNKFPCKDDYFAHAAICLRKRSYRCLDCSAKFTSYKKFASHNHNVKNVHIKVEPLEPINVQTARVQIVKNEKPVAKLTTRRSKRLTFTKVPRSEKTYACRACNVTFYLLSDFRQHNSMLHLNRSHVR